MPHTSGPADCPGCRIWRPLRNAAEMVNGCPVGPSRRPGTRPARRYVPGMTAIWLAGGIVTCTGWFTEVMVIVVMVR
jgi:hypothetical protein